MFFKLFWGILGLYILFSLLILPMQYRLLTALKKNEDENKAKGKTQGEMYDSMRVDELVLHENIQGNPIFFLANWLASVIYRIKH
ncbi:MULTISPECIES: DUF3949 domain-containing protein [unclassified Cytobacillus]|uniref:DUF3949 domain-containing protein n=1 Tax=unclassified Cytobacillus TaxID=2675268 RepID=UPI00135BED8F|nr:DUF3949 domain-containing protein [Cytobacillus sp. AMY 15.2]KAF0820800.1 hypothetical protein KIS4809_0327 [Bacillus sp. ZZV12-4809]MCM3093421.1 DUF3949 domain-containing protein [Cytobacillus sp. AMY 15.2]